MIQIRCICGNVLRVPESRAGQTGKCPNCGESITVPKVSPHKGTTPEESHDGALFSPTKKRFSILGLLIYLIFIMLVAGCILMATTNVFDEHPGLRYVKSYYYSRWKSLQNLWASPRKR